MWEQIGQHKALYMIMIFILFLVQNMKDIFISAYRGAHISFCPRLQYGSARYWFLEESSLGKGFYLSNLRQMT